MYEVIKSVISSGIYELSAMITKIETIWLESRITDEQKEELIQLARDNADLSSSMDYANQIILLNDNLRKLEERIIKLEEGGSEPTTSDSYPDYDKDKWYYNGDKITYKKEKYVCIIPEGQPCIYSPKDYPEYWQKVE